jgi:transcriptional regulator with XRE-family HTH domain
MYTVNYTTLFGVKMGSISRTRIIRKMLDMTQEEFGAAIGSTQSNVNFYENKAQTVLPKVAKKIIVLARSRGFAIGYEDIYGPADEA